MTADHIAELERRIEHLERAFVAVSELPTNNDAYNDSSWWYAKGWNDALKEMRKWLDPDDSRQTK